MSPTAALVLQEEWQKSCAEVAEEETKLQRLREEQEHRKIQKLCGNLWARDTGGLFHSVLSFTVNDIKLRSQVPVW